MAERASLKRPGTLVNRVPAIIAFFLLASCVQENTKDQSVTIKSVTASIVWQTPTFDETPLGFALSPDAPSLLMVSFEQSGLKVFDVDGADVSPEFAPFFPGSLSDGILADFDGSALRLFFATDSSVDKLSVFAYADGLKSPTRLLIDPEIKGGLDGVCVSPSDTTGSIARLGYWTKLDNTTLVVGEIRSASDGKLSFIETERVRHGKYLTSCALDGDMIATGGGFGLQFLERGEDPTVFDIPGVPVELAYLQLDGDKIAAFTLSGGDVYVANTTGTLAAVSFRPGLSSNQPDRFGSLALSRQGNVGGLPQGYLAGESISSGGTQIVYVDLKALADQL